MKMGKKATRQSIKRGREAIDVANTCVDYCKKCGIPSLFSIKGVDYQVVSHTTGSELPRSRKEEVFSIFKSNMLEAYQLNWGWDAESKWAEMFSERSHYLMILNPNSEIIAFSHFQFVWDDDDDPDIPVLYCFEIQVLQKFQRNGIGKYIMEMLECIQKHFGFIKLSLTVFRSNSSAIYFYKQIGFEIDDLDPSNHDMPDENYRILSKKHPASF